MQPFTHNAAPARIIFGRGSIAQAAEEVRRIGSQSLVLSTPQQAAEALALAT